MMINVPDLSDSRDAETDRLNAMALDIEKRDAMILKLQDAVHREREENAGLRRQLARCCDEISQRPLRIIAGWKLPPSPMCPCGSSSHAAAYNTGDGWLFEWSCDANCGEALPPILDWPFVGDEAWPSDWTAIDVEVV